MKASGTILIVESDTVLADKISEQIVALGCHVLHSRTLGEAAAAIGTGASDLAVLGAEMHDDEHVETLRRLRISSDIPIIVTTNRADLDVKLKVLGLGIDDYIVKPFDLRELKVRMRNILRRTNRAESKDRYVEIDGMKIDFENRIVIDRSGHEQPLTRAEADMLKLLVLNEGIAIQREQLFDNTKATDEKSDRARRVDILVSRLRRKLERDPAHPSILITVRGIGYRLRKPVR